MIRRVAKPISDGHKPVHIAGAGLAGLVLARTLLRHGQPSVLWEEKRRPNRHYAITLQDATIKPLSMICGLSTAEFQSRVAVDSTLRGCGRIDPASGSAGFRASRDSLERELMSNDMDIRWDTVVTKANPSPKRGRLHLYTYRRGYDERPVQQHATLLVDASGSFRPGFSVRYPSLAEKYGTDNRTVHPYVVFRNKVFIQQRDFVKEYAPHLGDLSIIEHRIAGSNTRLEISIASTTYSRGSEAANATDACLVALSYIYSRPAQSGDDVLYNPNRSRDEAHQIPDALLDEIRALPPLPPPFNTFTSHYLKGERTTTSVNWLMRTYQAPLVELEELARQRVVLLGDSWSTTPILGGNGANAAIQDAIALGEHIVAQRMGPGLLVDFVRNRWPLGKQRVTESLKELDRMHGVQSSAASSNGTSTPRRETVPNPQSQSSTDLQPRGDVSLRPILSYITEMRERLSDVEAKVRSLQSRVDVENSKMTHRDSKELDGSTSSSFPRLKRLWNAAAALLKGR